MASTRSSTTRQRRAVREASTDATPKAPLTTLARVCVRIEIAACTAAAGWPGLLGAGRRLAAQTVGEELFRRVDGESDSPELAARLTAATSLHLRELATLPRMATDHFDARLARVSSDI